MDTLLNENWVKTYLQLFEATQKMSPTFFDTTKIHEILDQALLHSPLAYFIINYQQMKLEYASPGLKQFLGEEFELFSAMGPSYSVQKLLPNYCNIIIEKVVPNIKYFLKSCEVTSRKNIQFSYNYQIEINRKVYHLCQEMRVIESLPDGTPVIALACMYDISGVANHSIVHYSIKKIETNSYEQVFEKTYPVPKAHSVPYSKAEERIIELINTGLNTKEMAVKLNISEETIKKHRKNIVRKAGVKNIFKLLH